MTEHTDDPSSRRKRDRISQSNNPPSFPFYWRDWLASFSVGSMTNEQRGGYITYLCRAQSQDRPGIQTKDEVRAMAGFTPEEWVRHEEAFRRCFHVRKDGLWVQRRVVNERAAQKRRYKRAVNAGKEGARKRGEHNGLARVAGTQAGPKHQPYPYPDPDPDPEKLEKQVVPCTNRVTGARVDASGMAGSNPITALLESVLGTPRAGEGGA